MLAAVRRQSTEKILGIERRHSESDRLPLAGGSAQRQYAIVFLEYPPGVRQHQLATLGQRRAAAVEELLTQAGYELVPVEEAEHV